MKLYVTKDCEDSIAVVVAFRLSGLKGSIEIVPSDFKHISYLKTTKQVPSLQLQSGDYLFTAESILLYLIPSVDTSSAKYLTTSEIKLDLLNLEIPSSSTFGEDETISYTDMVLYSKLCSLLHSLKASENLYSKYPRVGFWFDKVSSDNMFASTMKDIGYVHQHKNISHQKDQSINKNLPQELPKKQVSNKAPSAMENFLQVNVSSEQKQKGIEKWNQGFPSFNSVLEQHPKKPIAGKKNNLITSALPYVNNVPHLGNIIGCVLSADAFSRYCRLKNENTLYICGTDEYGTATETKALAEGVTPQQICDKYHVLHRDVYSWFNISFDYFGRTTTPQQTEIAQDIFWKLHNNGYSLAQTVEQLFCVQCKKFLADRFVEGTCPFCDYDDARGDQCDKCSKLINPTELKDPKCKVCSAKPEIKTSRHLFVDLPNLEDNLKKFTVSRESIKGYNSTALSITNSWIKNGLKPRCITRDLKWGTPVPHKDYKDKVFYVWFDAPIGYLSITANYMKDWELWWKNPEQVTLYQFMAKDNVPFHSVIFPACLLATKDNYTLVNYLDGIDYLQYEGRKFSKSRGVGVFGDAAAETNIPCDIFRCYLLLNRPETSDTNFTWDGLAQINNNILLNNFGNFVLRALTFCKNSFGSTIPIVIINSEDEHFIALVNGHLSTYMTNFDSRLIGRAFESVFAISKIGNQYLQYNTPWVLAKGSAKDKARAGSVIGLASNVAALLSMMVSPFMPTISNIVNEQLNMPDDKKYLVDNFVPYLKPGHQIGNPFPLFSKIDDQMVRILQEKFSGDSSDTVAQNMDIEQLKKKIETQGNKVRQLKTSKADPTIIKAEVAILLDLKKKLPAEIQPLNTNNKKTQNKAIIKTQTKQQNPPKVKVDITPEIAELQKQIEAQATKVREIKASGSAKAVIDAEVKILLEFKSRLPAELQPQPNKKGKKKK